LKKNIHESIEGHAVLVMLYHALGCGGEVLASNWDTSLWEQSQGGCFNLDWGEVKGAKKDSFLDSFPDAVGFQICMIHSLVSYLINFVRNSKSFYSQS
jgi:hypothetical protein